MHGRGGLRGSVERQEGAGRFCMKVESVLSIYVPLPDRARRGLLGPGLRDRRGASRGLGEQFVAASVADEGSGRALRAGRGRGRTQALNI